MHKAVLLLYWTFLLFIIYDDDWYMGGEFPNDICMIRFLLLYFQIFLLFLIKLIVTLLTLDTRFFKVLIDDTNTRL